MVVPTLFLGWAELPPVAQRFFTREISEGFQVTGLPWSLSLKRRPPVTERSI